jgi:integrase
MKTGRPHRVALSERVVGVLEAQRAAFPNSPIVFPRAGGRRPVPTRAVWALAKRLNPDISVHGFRSTFRDWVAEQTTFPREAAELALAHRVGTEVERRYQRGDMLQRRRELAEAWSTYCTEPPAPVAVVPMRRGGRRGR